jgi:hypothetical protein
MRSHAIESTQPPGIAMPPMADMGAQLPIVAATLATNSTAQAPRKPRSPRPYRVM